MENQIKVGDRFGKLVVLAVPQSYRAKSQYCLCKCDCGRIGVMVTSQRLLDGETIAYSVCQYGIVDKHEEGGVARRGGNHSQPNPLMKHPLHRVWSDMIMRCENPKRPSFYLYGARGIRVCKEWREDYLVFYDWAMNNGYKIEKTENGRNKYTLDRIDCNGDYCPENCRWVDYREQNNNRRECMIVEFNGEKKSIKEFLKDFNATVYMFFYLLRQGNNELEALEIISKM